MFFVHWDGIAEYLQSSGMISTPSLTLLIKFRIFKHYLHHAVSHSCDHFPINVTTVGSAAGAVEAKKTIVKFLVVCGVTQVSDAWYFGTFVGFCRTL